MIQFTCDMQYKCHLMTFTVIIEILNIYIRYISKIIFLKYLVALNN